MKKHALRFSAMLAIASAVVVSAMTSVFAQNTSSLRVGLLGGVNYNYVDAATQNFVQIPGDPTFTLNDFSGASSLGGYGGIMGEYLFNDLIGVSLRASFDARCVEKEDGDAKFTPHLWYVSVEPGVRVNLGLPELHANVGGTVGINMLAQYDYAPGSFEGAQDVEGVDMENVNDVAFGAWAGLAYDFRLSAETSSLGLYVTPFAEGSYMFDQKEADVTLEEDEMWNTLTVRGGVQVKLEF